MTLRPLLPAAVALGLLISLGGCAAPSAAPDSDGAAAPADSSSAPAGEDTADADTADEVVAERPEGLDANLPVPPGTLISATQETSAWEYIYGDITDDEARSFAEGLAADGFEVMVHVDSEGVEQWYLQSSAWAVKLEQTHDAQQLRYWVDPISE